MKMSIEEIIKITGLSENDIKKCEEKRSKK